MARRTRQKKDRTSFIISTVIHVLVIGGVAYWAWKTGKLEQIGRRMLEWVKAEKKQPEKEPPKQAQQKPPPSKLPPINQGMPQQASGGTRRAVAADAPAAAGDSFFQDTRKQGQGPSTAGGGGASTAPQLRIVTAPPPPPPRMALKSASSSSISQLLTERSKAAASVEAVGSEQITKSGATDAGATVTKIAGATIAEGKFAVIRGLNDHYIATLLNGAGLPSADPYHQSAPLDLFPAQVIDRVVVTKTFMPDQPGTATGGGIDVITKSFPERPFLTFSLGAEYNTQATGNNDFLTSKGGGTDWAAIDDGTRELPQSLKGQGVPQAPASSGVIGTPIFFQSTSNANLLNSLTHTLGRTDFAPDHEAPPPNQNFSIVGGGSGFLFGQPVGYLAAGSYKQTYLFDPEGTSSRYQNGTQLKNSYQNSQSFSIVNWSAMANLAYKPFENHELGFTFFYNQNSIDEAQAQLNGFERTDPNATFRKFNLMWTQRNLNTYQVKGQSDFPQAGGLQFNWLAAFTQTTQDEPNSRFFNDIDSGNGPTTGNNSVPIPSNPTRYYRNLDENNQNVKLDWTLPFHNWTPEEGRLKWGLFDSTSDRSFVDRAYSYPGGGGYGNDPNNFLTDTNLGLDHIRTNFVNGRPRSLTFFWNQYIQGFDSSYDGHQDVQAAYLMTEFPLAEQLKLVGGARLESTDITIHSESYRASNITGTNVNNTKLQQTDVLPAAGLIYSLTTNMNFRLNFSQTIARPSFREMAAYFSYDPVINDYVEGNPTLKMTSINNYDVRWEWFPRAGEFLSASLFYKDLRNAIERGDIKQEGDVITWFNDDKATIYGVEFEARQSLNILSPSLSPFSLGGNVSFIESEVKLTADELKNKRAFLPGASSTRPLYDQSPYIINADFSYSNARSGTTASLIYNVAGPRIVITKINTDDVYEQPAPMVDFVISQKIGRKTTLRFTAKNLLDPKFERTYGEDSNLLYDSYKKGRTFGLTLVHEF